MRNTKDHPAMQAERERNRRIYRRMMVVHGVDEGQAIATSVYHINKSAALCRNLDLHTWEAMFPNTKASK